MNVPMSTLMKLPTGCTILGNTEVNGVQAITVLWQDRSGLRKSDFAIDGGEYLGDHIIDEPYRR